MLKKPKSIPWIRVQKTDRLRLVEKCVPPLFKPSSRTNSIILCQDLCKEVGLRVESLRHDKERRHFIYQVVGFSSRWWRQILSASCDLWTKKPCMEGSYKGGYWAVAQSTFFIIVCCHLVLSSLMRLVGSTTCTLRGACKAKSDTTSRYDRLLIYKGGALCCYFRQESNMWRNCFF